MTFGAMTPWQAAAFMVAAMALAYALFRLRVRPRRMRVPSLLIWQHVLDRPRDETWWERFRRAVSLVATVLIALLLAVAFIRPDSGGATAGGNRLLVVLDTSWSMRARTADGATRWARAVALARALARSAAGEPVTLATSGVGVVEGPTTDTALIETALDDLEPTGDSAVWPAAVDGEIVHYITDGATERTLSPAVVVHSVFEPAVNVAITAFDVRPAASADRPGAAYLEVANYGDEARQVRLTVTRGTEVVLDAPVDLGPGEVDREVVRLAPSGDARLIAHVSTDGPDALPDDDEAVAWIADAAPLAVAVVGDGSGPMASLLQRFSGIRTTAVGTRDPLPDAIDVVVFESGAPPRPPDRPALLLGATPAAWLGRPGAEEREPRWTVAGGHPVLEGVDPLTIGMTRAGGLVGDRLQVIAQSDRGTPLVDVVDEPQLRLVALTFGLADSNLATAPAFPLLVGNALEWLARPAVPTPIGPGSAVLPRGTSRVVGPDGSEIPLIATGERTYARLTRPGLYRIDLAGARSVVAVNAGDPLRSNLQRTEIAEVLDSTTDAGDTSGRPWWIFALVLAMVVVSVEWVTWLRRITV